jgi:uncharacterized membrane protein
VFTLLRSLVISRRVGVAAVLGLAVYFILPAGLMPAMRGAIAWDIAIVLFAAMTIVVVGEGSPEGLKRRASQGDTRLWIILTITVVAAAASLASLAFVLQKPEGASATAQTLFARISVAGATLVLSWAFVQTMFAIRYAHYFYGDPDDDGQHRAGLTFPGTDRPDFWDFMYYAFVVGMTCQVSDVQVDTRQMRRLTLAHGVLAFFFNAGVLALAVNILATAL